MNPISYTKSIITELRLVEWLSGKELAKLTGVVIAVSVFLGAFIYVLDLIFFKLRELIF